MESNKEAFIIHRNHKKLILFISGSLFLTILCFILAIFDWRVINLSGIFELVTQSQILYYALKIILIVGFFFFGYCFVYYMKSHIAKEVILQIDHKGVIDNASEIELGFISWNDIERIYIVKVMGKQLIQIKIRNEEQYLSKLNSFKRKMVKVNLKMGYEIISITLNATKYNIKDICDLMNEYLIEYQGIIEES